MPIASLTSLFAIASGGLIGLVLGLVGGGGSIVSVPLLVYLVGIASPHVAIGTAAVAVAVNAIFSLSLHARQGTVKLRCALVFAAAGVVGTLIGAEAGKAMDGQRLLALFGLLMIAVGLAMVPQRRAVPKPEVRLTRESAARLLPALLGIGFAVGLLAGFFGIGGGFLIVPGLMLATGMPITNAVGTSLVAVSAFGTTTAVSYAASGLVDWWVAILVIAGGGAGTVLGVRLGRHLAVHKRMLNLVFAAFVVATGLLVAGRGLTRIWG